MRRKIFFKLIFIFLFTSTAFAETTLKAEVDKKKLSTDQTLTYKVILETTERDIQKLELPKFEGFKQISTAQSSEVVFSGGKNTNSIGYIFVLIPVKTGKLTIPPARIKVNNKPFETDSFEIEVEQGKEIHNSPPVQADQPEITI